VAAKDSVGLHYLSPLFNNYSPLFSASRMILQRRREWSRSGFGASRSLQGTSKHTTLPSNILLHPVLLHANSHTVAMTQTLRSPLYPPSTFGLREKLDTILYHVEHFQETSRRKKLLDERGEIHRCHNDHNCDGTDKTQTRREQITVGLDDE